VVFIIAFGATYILCSIKEVIFSLSDDHICSMALIPALNYFDLFLDFFKSEWKRHLQYTYSVSL